MKCADNARYCAYLRRSCRHRTRSCGKVAPICDFGTRSTAIRQPRRTPSTRSRDVRGHRASRRHRGARTDDAGIMPQTSRACQLRIAQSRDRCDRARTMCGARRAMCGALAFNVRSSRRQCAELDPLASLRSSRKFGVSEIRNFRHYSNTRNIPASDGPSCPVLSCPVLWSRSFRTDVRINADEKRTRCGRKADTNPTGALRTRFGLKLGVSRRRRRRAGHLSRASACGHRWTSVRIKADRMRTESGQMSASMRTECGQDADEKRTRPQPISMDGRSSARMHAAMTAPVVSLSPRR